MCEFGPATRDLVRPLYVVQLPAWCARVHIARFGAIEEPDALGGRAIAVAALVWPSQAYDRRDP